MKNWKKRSLALSLAICMILTIAATLVCAAETGWYGPDGATCFAPVSDTVALTWLPDAAEDLDLTDGSFEDWVAAGVDPLYIGPRNVVAWYGNIPADWAMDVRFAVDGDNLYVAASVTDAEVVADDRVDNPFDPANIVNYNTGDNIQLAIDFGNIIEWTLQNDPDSADYMANEKAIFYSIGFRGDGEDVCISVQESHDDHILGRGDGNYRVGGERSGARGKTFLTNDGWAAEFCIPLSELFYDVCYKTFNDCYNDMIWQSIVMDEDWPLEIGLNVYHMNWGWSTDGSTKQMTGAFGLHTGQNVDRYGDPIVTWGAEDLATALTLDYEDGMAFSSPYILTPDKDYLEYDTDLNFGDGTVGDVALGKRVSINNGNTVESYRVDGWGLQALTDGWTNNGWHSNLFGFAGLSYQKPTILTVNLEAIYRIDCVNLYPYTGDDYEASIMPRAYSIQAFSVEDDAWVEVASDSNVVAANGVLTPDAKRVEVLSYEFSPIYATRVRVLVYEESGIRIGGTCDVTCIGEIEILAAEEGDNDLDFEIGEEPQLHEKNGIFNVALGKNASVNNGNAYEESLLLWGLPYMIDGSIYSAWVNNPEEIVSSANAPTILTVNLGGTYEISLIELYPYAVNFEESTMPTSYIVEVYSSERDAWVVVGRERSAYVEPGSEADSVFAYEFDAVTASRVRVTIVADSDCYMDTITGVTAIGEIAVWGLPARAQGGNETRTETETTPEPEPETEAVSETAPEADSETAVESETAAKDTTASAETETGAKHPFTVEGCASSAGIGAVSVLTVAAAAVLVKRKER